MQCSILCDCDEFRRSIYSANVITALGQFERVSACPAACIENRRVWANPMFAQDTFNEIYAGSHWIRLKKIVCPGEFVIVGALGAYSDLQRHSCSPYLHSSTYSSWIVGNSYLGITSGLPRDPGGIF